MDTDDKIAFVAVLIGMGQMGILTNKLVNTNDISYYSTEYVVSGIVASTLWTVYQYRKGSNFSAIYSSAGLFLGLYILQRLLKEKAVKKRRMKTIIHKLQFGTIPPKNRRRKRPTTNASNGSEGPATTGAKFSIY